MGSEMCIRDRPSSEREATRMSKTNEGSKYKHIARSSLSEASRDASQRSDESGIPINGSQRQVTPLTHSYNLRSTPARRNRTSPLQKENTQPAVERNRYNMRRDRKASRRLIEEI